MPERGGGPPGFESGPYREELSVELLKSQEEIVRLVQKFMADPGWRERLNIIVWDNPPSTLREVNRARPKIYRQLEELMAAYRERWQKFSKIGQEEIIKNFNRLMSQSDKETKLLLSVIGKQLHEQLVILSATVENYVKPEAEKLDLEPLWLHAYPTADLLLQEAVYGEIDFAKLEDRATFCRRWVEAHPDLPLPCVPPEELFKKLYPDRPYPDYGNKSEGDFWYLKSIVDRLIVKNVKGRPRAVMPYFGKTDLILVESWPEANWPPDESSLLKRLGSEYTRVAGLSRAKLDSLLWRGDPGDRLPSEAQTNALNDLGLHSDYVEIRCINWSEYARGAELYYWGDYVLYTHFDDYSLRKNKTRLGLVGGNRNYGGASDVSDIHLDSSTGDLATRLVVARKSEGVITNIAGLAEE